MNRSYIIIRAIMVMIILLVIAVPAVLYIGLSLPPVQRHIAAIAEKELSKQLAANVDIGQLTITPFNRVMLRDVSIALEEGRDTVMTIDRLGSGINLYELLYNREIVINYVEVIGLNLKITQDSASAPLNIQPIIDRIAKKDPDKTPSSVNLAINTVVLRNSVLAFDRNDTPLPNDRYFSPNHIKVYDLSADLLLPSLGNKGNHITVKRFRMKEQSGLEITNFTGNIELTPDLLAWSSVAIDMPGSSLKLSDCRLPNSQHLSIPKLITGSPLDFGIEKGSHISLYDLSALLPLPETGLDPTLDLELHLSGQIDEDSRLHVNVGNGHEMKLNLSANIHNITDSIAGRIEDIKLNANLDLKELAGILPLNPRQTAILETAQHADMNLKGNLSRSRATIAGHIISDVGSAQFDTHFTSLDTHRPHYKIDIETSDIDLGGLLNNQSLGLLTAAVRADGHIDLGPSGLNSITSSLPTGTTEIEFEQLGINRHTWSDINAIATTTAKSYNIEIESGDPAALFTVNANGLIEGNQKSMNLKGKIVDIDLGEVTNNTKFNGKYLRFNTTASLTGTNIDDIDGQLAINNIIFLTPDYDEPVKLDGLQLATNLTPDGTRTIELESDMISGLMQGQIYFSSIGSQLKEIVSQSIKALNPSATTKSNENLANNFEYNFKIHDTEQWANRLRLPISNLGESIIFGHVNNDNRDLSLNISAPYLRQGNKLIEGTSLNAAIEGLTGESILSFTTKIPTKEGLMQLNLDADASDDNLDTELRWHIDRAARYEGIITTSTRFDATPDGGTAAHLSIHPSNLTFNDSTWYLNRATVDIYPESVNIHGINAHRDRQFVKIDGRASHNPDDEISIDLLGINLDYIFESLGIDKVMLGGDATGRFFASNLYSSEPRLLTEGLNVKAISYNKVVLGDAIVNSRWDKENRAITLDAVVEQDNGEKTLIDGAIYPLNDSLDITFDAHNVDVSFMYPYMSAFASEVSGRASGVARLWGNFKYIDMEGDIAGEDLKLKIAFTNTSYTTSDTVKLRLGEITLDNMTLTDTYGNTAKLSGKVWHKYFKEPRFEFNVTDANNLMVYDETSRQNPDWYGNIFGNGSAHIDGGPGIVNIKVDMSTAPGSIFTFVLNDMEEASDYTFITFRNRDEITLGETEKIIDDTPSTVRRLREMLAQKEAEQASVYNIDLQMDITPSAAINLVMDPVGGDRIRSRGNGNLRMLYQSSDNELHMYGSYTLDQGNYNFTLQDIIIKDFTIKPGSTISFTGDPFAASLDIKAAYNLTANLSDLDESFSQDKDLNRTTVPVNAILLVNGAIQQPEISFDLEFPTLTQDTYRKVRSIVSTEEMMNRQIIYLLALSRFYTPDYMGSTSRGNELASVASSTISSQLGNILGSLSDNWNIAPSFRSDRGDFSDVEVDVALSSSLLNNRLLFNGNFGYRDKTLNNTQFIGDFDIEYLLNRAGTLRLKGYNRYNDMNYYVRTAQTTQGVGISFRRNFDNLSDFFHPNRRK